MAIQSGTNREQGSTQGGLQRKFDNRSGEMSGHTTPTLCELLEPRVLLSITYLVTTTSDAGAGTLRQAIIDANASAGPDIIAFEIGSGIQQIQPLSALPAITDPVLLDATTQGGYAGTPLVWLDGGSLSSDPADGLTIVANDSTVRGLAITDFNQSGILIQGSGDSVLDCYLGVAPDGTTGAGNGVDGITVAAETAAETDAAPASAVIQGNVISANWANGITFAAGFATSQVLDNRIGVDASGSLALGNFANGIQVGPNDPVLSGLTIRGDVISGNCGDGIYLDGTSNTVVTGNVIGTDAAGTTSTDANYGLLSNIGDGVEIVADLGPATNNTIGGPAASDRNLISGNFGNGVWILDAADNVVQGNYIGTDLTGTGAIPNSANGVAVWGANNRVVDNLVSGNYGDGVFIQADATIVQGNRIGTQADGTSALSNTGDGIWITGSGNRIGGGAGQGNVIACNVGNGVAIAYGTGNAVRGNSIYSNGSDPDSPGIGIDLGLDGVTINNVPGHDGPNLYQNFPVLAGATRAGSAVTVDAALTAGPSQSYTIEFFTNAQADPSEYGQGQTFVGSVNVTTDAGGDASFTCTLSGVPAGQNYLTATATDADGNTSEFSLALDIIPQVGGEPAVTTTTLTSSINPSLFGQTVLFTAAVTDLSAMGIPAGQVTFMDGSMLLGTGELDAFGLATLSISNFTVGDHVIVASYIGGSAFAASASDPLTQTVNPLPSSLGGKVFVDNNNDGVAQAGEPGIAGVEINLVGTDDLGQDVSITIQTKADGSYLFVDLRPGTYSLIETQPAGYLQGKIAAGTAAGIVGADQITDIVLDKVQGQNAAGYNFGELVAGSFSGTVFLDANDNNVFDAGEAGIADVSVTLTGTDDLGNDVSILAQTNSAGLYGFTQLRPGAYEIVETQPVGYLDAAGAVNLYDGISISSGFVADTLNFAEIQPGSLAGSVYLDANNNGVLNSGEAGISAVTVSLTGTDDLGQSVTASAQTGIDGDYLFEGLRPGSYQIAETQPSGFEDGLDAFGSLGGIAGNDIISAIPLASGQAGTGYNFGERTPLPTPGMLSGRGLRDTTGNGLSGDDTPLAGLTINLYLDRNHDGKMNDGSPVATMTTASDSGAYSFTGLAPGRYFVQEVVPCGFIQTAPALSTYYSVQVADGVNAANLDFDNFLKPDTCRVTGVSYLINSTTTVSDLRGKTREGDLVQVVFTITPGAPVELSLVSYTAPDSSFVAGHASQQAVFDLDTGVFAPGTYTMSVSDPDSYYQVDFVAGPAIDVLGPAGSNIFYTPQGRLISADNGGVDPLLATGSGISGTIYNDANLNGKMDAGEVGLGNVSVTLSGADTQGHAVRIVMLTDLDGQYKFSNLQPGTYSITESQPVDFVDGEVTIGSAGGTVVAKPASGTSALSGIVLAQGVQAAGNNFGELAVNLGPALLHGQAATILFWKSSLGQTLIKAFNGSSNSTALGNWLASNFPRLYGSKAGSHNLAGKTNSQVASLFTTLYNMGGMRLDAQVMGLALSVYATNSKLAGSAAQKYGFLVDGVGAGAATYNVGDSGAAFDVATNTTMRILDILKETDGDAINGVLYNNSAALCMLAYLVYSDINTIGGVS